MKLLAHILAAFIPGSLRRKTFRLFLTCSQPIRPYVYRSYKAHIRSGVALSNEFSAVAQQYQFNPPSDTYTLNPAWKTALRTTPSRILEIGSWQGSSTVIWNYLYPTAQITCVDIWAEYDQMDVALRPEEFFDKNTTGFADRLRKIKSDSALALAKLHADGEQFDCIYIDGSHFEDDVLVDTMLAWRLLPVGGSLIMDDYGWKHSKRAQINYGDKVPKTAIDHFLNRHIGEYIVLSVYPQIMIEKVKTFRAEKTFTPKAKPRKHNITAAD